MVSFFTEKTSTSHYFEPLTGLRGLAAIMVLLFHVASDLNKATDLDDFWVQYLVIPLYGYGFLGVQLFFVLSGFLLSFYFLSAQKKKQTPSLKTFSINRCLRVLPSYYVQLCLLVCFGLVFLGEAIDWYDLLLHALMLHNISFQTNGSFNGVYWTLPIEWDFYFIIPLLAMCLIRKRIIWLVLTVLVFGLLSRIFVGELVLNQALPIKRVWLLSQLPVIPEYFVLGMFGAYIRFNDKWKLNCYGDTMMLLGAFLFIYCVSIVDWSSYWENSQYYWWNSLSALSVALFVLGASANGRVARLLFTNKIMLTFGILSYGIYLWHTVVIKALIFETSDIGEYIIANGATPVQGLLITTFIVILLTLFVSYLNHILVEKPFLKLKPSTQKR